MAIATLLEAATHYYEDRGASAAKKQVDEVLFPLKDDSLAATVKIDDYTGNGYAMAFIKKGAPANVRPYTPGSGYEYEVLTAKEKTPIDETLRDSTVGGGISATSPQAQHLRYMTEKIISGPKGFVNANIMMRRKMAMDLMLEGKMVNYDEDGNAVQVDFLRDGTLTKTNDFSAVKIDEALTAQFAAMQPFLMPHGGLAVILGSSWLLEFQKDSVVIEKRKATAAPAYVVEQMTPQLLQGCEGLYVVGQYRPNGLEMPIWLLTYSPEQSYCATKGGALTSYMPAAKMVMFNLGGQAWRCNRGLDVLNSKGKIVRAVGDLVIDGYVDNDPVVEYLRSNARTFMVRGNINHTSVCTGSAFN